MKSSTYWPLVRRQGKRLVGWCIVLLIVLLTLATIGVSFDTLPVL